MQRSWWIASALSALFLIPAGASAQSKPANLPDNQQIECPDCQETGRGTFSLRLGINLKGITFDVDVRKAEPNQAPVIDTVSPTIVPMYLDMLLRYVGGVLAPGTSTTDESSGRAVIGATDQPQARVRQLYEVGEVYRRLGLYSSARFYYQRVHSLQPTTDLGRQAIERLTEIEGRLREAEESGADDPEEVFNQMRERTMLLGMVELTY